MVTSLAVVACSASPSGGIVEALDGGPSLDANLPRTTDTGASSRDAARIDTGAMTRQDISAIDLGADVSAVDASTTPDVTIAIDLPPAADVAILADTTSSADVPSLVDTALPTDVASADGGTGEVVTVYAHTSSALFAVNPSTLDVTSIGLFGFPADSYSHQMTDLAVTAGSQLWGVTFNALYRINSTTAACTLVAGLAGGSVQFNALSFVPAGLLGASESLVASTVDGIYYEVNTATGTVTSLGVYGLAIGSSGDIVSVAGAGTYATVTRLGTEYLATLNPHTGAATIIGPTGVSGTWGLGYWRALLYGFTEGGDFVTIDITTGHATTVRSYPAQSWWGAGVTTVAPTDPQ